MLLPCVSNRMQVFEKLLKYDELMESCQMSKSLRVCVCVCYVLNGTPCIVLRETFAIGILWTKGLLYEVVVAFL